jgi:putative ABC transport system permease protein
MFAEWLNNLQHKLKAMGRRERLDRDLEDEVSFHLAMREQQRRADGLSDGDARCAANRQFGNQTIVKERMRDMWTFVSLESFARDIRYAFRMLRKDAAFSAVAILTLALGIGANTAVFSVVNGVLLKSLPYPDPQQLVTTRDNDSLMNILDIQQHMRAFSQIGGITLDQMDYTSGDEPLRVDAAFINAGFLQLLGVQPMLGRFIAPEEDVKGGPPVIVVSYAFWRDFLSSDPSILGKTIRLSETDYTVIGVMPADFAPPREYAAVYASLWSGYPEAAIYRGVHFMSVYWRLRSGVTLAQAQEDIFSIDRYLAERYPDHERKRHTVLIPLQEYLVRDSRTALLVLFGAVGFVLLIACANFAALLLARNVARRQELLIRASLGAGKMRLVRQSLVESCVLSLLGGAGGLLLAKIGTPLLFALKPAALKHFTAIAIDTRVFLFVFAVSLLTGMFFGVAPGWSAAPSEFSAALKQGARGATAGPSGTLLRRCLVTAEIALAMVLLVGAGLLIRGFAHLRAVDPGFNPQNVMTMYLQLPAARYAQIPRQTQFRRQLLDRLNALPGVAAAMVSSIPFGDNYLNHKIVIDGRPPVPVGTEPVVSTLSVMGDYFHVMQIAVLDGRGFTPDDREGQPLVAVVNEAFVKEFFPHENPLGARVDWALSAPPRKWMTIVGVVRNTKDGTLSQPAEPTVYAPFPQSDESWRRWMTLTLRTAAPSPSLVDEAKKAIWSLDRQIPVSQIQPLTDLVAVSLLQQRFNMILLGIFAALALALAAIGIYGLMSYAVGQRTHEIGVRLAVGAQRRNILRLVVGDGARLAFLGVAIGIAAAAFLTRLMASLLFEITPIDPATFSTVAILLLLVGLLACYIPARRATRVDSIVALRCE